MKLIRLLMEAYEKSYNEEVTLIFQADGSGELIDFYDNSRVYIEFGNIKELEVKLNKSSDSISNALGFNTIYQFVN